MDAVTAKLLLIAILISGAPEFNRHEVVLAEVETPLQYTTALAHYSDQYDHMTCRRVYTNGDIRQALGDLFADYAKAKKIIRRFENIHKNVPQALGLTQE